MGERLVRAGSDVLRSTSGKSTLYQDAAQSCGRVSAINGDALCLLGLYPIQTSPCLQARSFV